MVLVDVDFSNNSARIRGGAVRLAGRQTAAAFERCTVAGNRAGGAGGGVHVDGGAFVSLDSGSRVERNEAGTDGGGVFARSQSATLAATFAAGCQISEFAYVLGFGHVAFSLLPLGPPRPGWMPNLRTYWGLRTWEIQFCKRIKLWGKSTFAPPVSHACAS